MRFAFVFIVIVAVISTAEESKGDNHYYCSSSQSPNTQNDSRQKIEMERARASHQRSMTHFAVGGEES